MVVQRSRRRLFAGLSLVSLLLSNGRGRQTDCCTRRLWERCQNHCQVIQRDWIIEQYKMLVHDMLRNV